MGVSLDGSLRIAGYRPAVFKAALAAFARTESARTFVDLKSVFRTRRDGAILLEECLDRALLDVDKNTLLPAGEIIARSKAQKRTPLDKAQVVLDQLLARADAINADPDTISQVDEIWLFGSLMRQESTVGDIDLAIAVSRKARFKDDHDGRACHADLQLQAFQDAPASWQFRWEKEHWLGRRALYGPRRHALLAGAQEGTEDLESLAVPCRCIFDRHRGGRVDDPVLERHPNSMGRNPQIEPPSVIPDLTPRSILPMDGRWLAGYGDKGEVSPYDIFRGWSDEAKDAFGGHPHGLRVFATGGTLDPSAWIPQSSRMQAVDGRSALMMLDTSGKGGISLILRRVMIAHATSLSLLVELGDVVRRSGKKIDFDSAPRIVAAMAMIVDADHERMVRRIGDQELEQKVEIRLVATGLDPEIVEYLLAPLEERLRTLPTAIGASGLSRHGTVALA